MRKQLWKVLPAVRGTCRKYTICCDPSASFRGEASLGCLFLCSCSKAPQLLAASSAPTLLRRSTSETDRANRNRATIQFVSFVMFHSITAS